MRPLTLSASQATVVTDPGVGYVKTQEESQSEVLQAGLPNELPEESPERPLEGPGFFLAELVGQGGTKDSRETTP